MPFNFSPPKDTYESQCKTATKPAAVEVEGSCHEDEMYEMIEMQATSLAKSRYAPAQTPQEDTATQAVHKEAAVMKTEADMQPAQEEGQETYIYCD